MTESLDNRVAIVTGGASGIGQAIVERFAEVPLKGITIADTNLSAAEKIASEIKSRTLCQVLAIETDISEQSQVRSMVDQTMDHFGRIDILVNNAGIAPITRWPEVTEENWTQVMNVNLHGAFLCIHSIWPYMREQQWGRIVNISSVGAFLGSITAHPAYGVSKAGLIALTKSAAKEMAPHGILVNAIAPGSIDTPILEAFGPEQREMYRKASLLKRQGDPQELANAVHFLVSDQSTYITGATLHVNGGSLLV